MASGNNIKFRDMDTLGKVVYVIAMLVFGGFTLYMLGIAFALLGPLLFIGAAMGTK